MRVMLATDGSGSAAVAAELVGNIRWPTGTSIDIVRVVGEGGQDLVAGSWPTVGFPFSPEAQAAVIRDAMQALVVVAEPLQKLGLNTNHFVLHGRPADALLDWIECYRPDLVIVGSRGVSPFERALVGSVSAELVDGSSVPVLVARRPTFERVVVAVDGSEIASQAVAAARRWPFLAMAEIRTLSVAPEHARWWPDELRTAGTGGADGEHEAARESLVEHDGIAAEAAAILRAVGFKAHPEVRVGSPASTIVEFATEWEADLVIMGSHGRTGLARLLLGSVARNVLHHASCSVLIVHRHGEPVKGKRAEVVIRPWTIVANH
jgi:nucleotide-binding universal stress UspA family protein